MSLDKSFMYLEDKRWRIPRLGRSWGDEIPLGQQWFSQMRVRDTLVGISGQQKRKRCWSCLSKLDTERIPIHLLSTGQCILVRQFFIHQLFCCCFNSLGLLVAFLVFVLSLDKAFMYLEDKGGGFRDVFC
ncbi:hypothetical protein CEXT_472581 [Caerostris extrusa]|uniref:Uncharacterized protein n=1 Tax=Caerostris extrusa TaxID=172846 RepID=A0AAV4T185_CAEEX|nr:hypothetical protein CEXT_472581 [Caerostris extrusa]